jgi:hypothetical protein
MCITRVIKFSILGFGLLAGFVLLLPILAHSQHFAFRHRSIGYYVEFTKACDSLLAQHPLGSNRFIEIPVADASLPGIVRNVHPFKIKLAANWVWILAWGEGHGDGVGITWEPEIEG